MRRPSARTHLLCLAVASSTWSCNDQRAEAELAALRARVAVLEEASTAGRVVSEHAHVLLMVTNFRGCRAAGDMKRVLVERTLAGNCGLELFFLEPDPANVGFGPCPKDYDLVVRWLGMPDGPQGALRLEQRGQQVYDDGRVLVGPNAFDCPSPTQIAQVWITPPGLKID
jgi:hypothetical protein